MSKKDEGAKQKENCSSDDESFSSSFDQQKLPMDNKNLQAITENFNIDFSAELTAFVGRIFELQFTELKFIDTKEILSATDGFIFSSFQIQGFNHCGMITFDPLLLHKVISFLYGSEGQLDTDASPVQFGKCSLKIAAKIVAIMLSSLQKATDDIHELQCSLADTNNNPKAIRTQRMPEEAYQMSFNINGMGVDTALNILLPQRLIEQITYTENSGGESSTDPTEADDQIRNDIIHSTIDLVALLPEIKLKLTDIMNLKSGDLISIPDPELVELKLGDRTAYKAVVGQANGRKVVKITHSLPK